MKSQRVLLGTAVLAFMLSACGGSGGSLPSGWQDAAEACASAFVLDQVVQARGEGFIPERVAAIPSEMSAAANKAADSSAEYDQLQLLVGNLVYAIEQGRESAVLDLVSVEGECEQLGFGTKPPQ